jgi:hypothetical protein
VYIVYIFYIAFIVCIIDILRTVLCLFFANMMLHYLRQKLEEAAFKLLVDNNGHHLCSC